MFVMCVEHGRAFGSAPAYIPDALSPLCLPHMYVGAMRHHLEGRMHNLRNERVSTSNGQTRHVNNQIAWGNTKYALIVA